MCVGQTVSMAGPFHQSLPKDIQPFAGNTSASLFQTYPPSRLKRPATKGQVPVCPLASKNLQACRSTPRGPDFRMPRPAAYAVPLPTQRSKEPSLQNVILPIHSQRMPAARPVAVGCIASQHRLETIRAFRVMSGHDFHYQNHQSTGLERSHDCPAPHRPHVLHAQDSDPRQGYLRQVRLPDLGFQVP